MYWVGVTLLDCNTEIAEDIYATASLINCMNFNLYRRVAVILHDIYEKIVSCVWDTCSHPQMPSLFFVSIH